MWSDGIWGLGVVVHPPPHFIQLAFVWAACLSLTLPSIICKSKIPSTSDIQMTFLWKMKSRKPIYRCAVRPHGSNKEILESEGRVSEAFAAGTKEEEPTKPELIPEERKQT